MLARCIVGNSTEDAAVKEALAQMLPSLDATVA